MKLTELAQQLFLSKTVIINVAKKLGYSGFGELKYVIGTKLSTVKDTKLTENAVKEQLKRTINNTFELTNNEKIVDAIELLHRTNKIFIVTRGTSKAAGYYLEHLLLSKGKQCIFIRDYNLSAIFTEFITPEDTVILLSLSGNTKKIVETAKEVQMRQGKIISITSFSQNSLSDLADVQLYCDTHSSDTKTQDVTSRIGFFIIIDLLIGLL